MRLRMLGMLCVALAIPVYAEDTPAPRHRTILGVHFAPVNNALQVYYCSADQKEHVITEIPRGPIVIGTIPGTSAEAARLRCGDIIESVGGVATPSFAALRDYVSSLSPGVTVAVKISRPRSVVLRSENLWAHTDRVYLDVDVTTSSYLDEKEAQK